MRRYALCLHDLRLSDGERIHSSLEQVRGIFNIIPVTMHLIVDSDPDAHKFILDAIVREVEEGELEVVFHGVTHKCPAGTGRIISFFHKYQAEFLGNSFDRDANIKRFCKISQKLQTVPGICPPCWIAGRKGWKFIEQLSPAYIERLLSFKLQGKKFFTIPVSLASDNKRELVFLKRLAALLTSLALLTHQTRVRLVVHTIDLQVSDSIEFLRFQKSRLEKADYIPVLQRDMIR